MRVVACRLPTLRTGLRAARLFALLLVPSRSFFHLSSFLRFFIDCAVPAAQFPPRDGHASGLVQGRGLSRHARHHDGPSVRCFDLLLFLDLLATWWSRVRIPNGSPPFCFFLVGSVCSWIVSALQCANRGRLTAFSFFSRLGRHCGAVGGGDAVFLLPLPPGTQSAATHLRACQACWRVLPNAWSLRVWSCLCRPSARLLWCPCRRLPSCVSLCGVISHAQVVLAHKTDIDAFFGEVVVMFGRGSPCDLPAHATCFCFGCSACCLPACLKHRLPPRPVPD